MCDQPSGTKDLRRAAYGTSLGGPDWMVFLLASTTVSFLFKERCTKTFKTFLCKVCVLNEQFVEIMSDQNM